MKGMALVKERWGWLEPYQKLFLIIVGILFPIGLIYPPVMELFLLPLSLVSCPG